MRIPDSKPEGLRSDGAGRIREEPPVGGEQKARPVPPVARTDRVEISDAARALAEQARAREAAEAEAAPTAGETSTDRTAELRARVAQGYYDQPQILSQVADRLLDSGDL